MMKMENLEFKRFSRYANFNCKNIIFHLNTEMLYEEKK